MWRAWYYALLFTSYNPEVHLGNGPHLLERILKIRCPGQNLFEGTNCSGVTVFPMHYFFPISTKIKSKIYKENDIKATTEILGLVANPDTRIFHIWTMAYGRRNTQYKWKSTTQAVAQIARLHCPILSSYARGEVISTSYSAHIAWERLQWRIQNQDVCFVRGDSINNVKVQ